MDSNNEPKVTVSDKSKPKKIQGKASRLKRQDSYRKSTNPAKMDFITAKLSANKFDDVADQFESILQSIRITESHVEAELPATTRGLGFCVAEAMKTAETLSPGLSQASQVDINAMYRIALLQTQVQQQQADYVERDVPKSLPFPIPSKQETQLPEEVVLAVKATPETFVNIATTVESFGRIRFNNLTFRTYQSTHRTAFLGEEPRVVVQGRRRRAEADQRTLTLPNPFAVSIQTLRDVVKAMADPETPVDQRNYFIQWNPIPGAIYQDGLLINPDEVMPQGYLTDQLYIQDLRNWRCFIGAATRRMASLIRPLSYSGEAHTGALISLPHPTASMVGVNIFRPPGRIIATSTYSLTKQQLLLGLFSLTGELPPQAPNVEIETSGYGVREASFQPVEIEISWQAVSQLYMTKR